MDKLLGHLAQFASFWRQGELLCSQGLAYLLSNADAGRAFADLVSERTGCSVGEGLDWRTEHCQADGGRPDLEGCLSDGTVTVKVEAKLDAAFGSGQLASYLADLDQQGSPGVLVVLVPTRRRTEAIAHIHDHLAMHGAGPWRLSEGSTVAVLTWEQAFAALRGVSAAGFDDNVAQLRALYRVLNGDDMEPITTDEQVRSWREREGWWFKLVDLTTRHLTQSDTRLLPIGLEQGPTPYYRRYVCSDIEGTGSCYSVGARHPFQNYQSPIWLRFHKATGHFREIAENLGSSDVQLDHVRSGGHLWFPLEVPRNSHRDIMVRELAAQVEKVIEVAYRGMDRSG